MKNSLKRNDLVVVIAGNDRGKVGKILKVLKGKERVVVEDVAVTKKHIRKSQEHPEGAIVEQPMPIHVSNVMLKSEKDRKLAKRNNKA